MHLEHIIDEHSSLIYIFHVSEMYSLYFISHPDSFFLPFFCIFISFLAWSSHCGLKGSQKAKKTHWNSLYLNNTHSHTMPCTTNTETLSAHMHAHADTHLPRSYFSHDDSSTCTRSAVPIWGECVWSMCVSVYHIYIQRREHNKQVPLGLSVKLLKLITYLYVTDKYSANRMIDGSRFINDPVEYFWD